MKKTLLLASLLPLALAILHADEPENPWTTLGRQSDAVAAALKARDTHALHELDHAIADEAAALEKGGSALPEGRKKKLNDLLADIAAQASAAHHDAHAAQWNDAAAAQAKLAADVKAAREVAALKD